MKKSELKEMIKSAFLNETEVFEAEATEVFTDAELDMASKMLMGMFDKLGLENNVEKSDALVKFINAWFETNDFVNEAEATEVFTDAELDMASKMLMGMFDKLGLENNVEKSDALVKFINAWFETNDFVNEAEEDVEVEDKEEIDIDTDAETVDAGEVDVEADAEVEMTGDTKEVQDNLQAALEAAKALGDQKLVDQIGNSITFFTRTHVVGKGEVAEADIDIDSPAEEAEIGMELNESFTRMQKLAGLIK